jgi:hypothetical protein
VPEHEFVEYVDAARRTAEDVMQAFTTTHADRLDGVSVQLIEGEPERAIPHFIDRNGIDLVVMGTVARSGIRGLVMGNTAERVLQRLRGSVLAVKPRDSLRRSSGRDGGHAGEDRNGRSRRHRRGCDTHGVSKTHRPRTTSADVLASGSS